MTPAALEHLKRFRRHLSTERRLSAHTDAAYARDLNEFVRFCGTQNVEDWTQIDSQHVRLFGARSHSRGLSPRSIQRMLSAVRSFFEYLVRERVLKSNPGKEVRAPKAERRLPNTLDADTMGRLLELPPGDDLTTRDQALMELLYSSGLRLAEVIGLNIDGVDLRDRMVTVTGKGNKTRKVPVGRKAVEALEKWLSIRSGLAKADERAMFVGRNGRRLGARAVQARVAYWARRQGIPSHVHPHLFRHSFASHLLESSGELRPVQEMLGHANLSTTQIYTHLDFQHLSRIYDATHPRARKKVR